MNTDASVEITWQGISIGISYVSNWLNTGHDHIELRAGERLPVTETGYRSRFLHPDELALFDGFEDFVRQWLDKRATDKAWLAYKEESRQLSFF